MTKIDPLPSVLNLNDEKSKELKTKKQKDVKEEKLSLALRKNLLKRKKQRYSKLQKRK
jgi:hypothetical protein